MKKSLIFIVMMLFTCLGYGQCETQNIIFNSQSQVDNFADNYPGCTTIGSITITGNINNLNGLSQLTSVTGYLFFQSLDDGIHYPLTDISGLYNLTSVGNLSMRNIPNINGANIFPNLITIGHSLTLDDKMPDHISGFNNLISVGYLTVRNTDLQSLNAFANLTTSKYISVESNLYLTNINGFGNLTTVAGSFYFGSNLILTALPNFQSLTSLLYGMVIQGNNALVDLHGLDQLETLNGYVTISNSNSLASLNGLNQLTTILGVFQIAQTYITNLDALNNVTTLPDVISILGNSLLNNIDGLSNVTTIPNSIYITNNPLLTECAITPICQKIAAGTGSFLVESNNLHCNTILEISDVCALSVAENKVVDLNNIYPNPTTSTLYIKNESGAKITKVVVYDALGRTNNVDFSNDAINVSAFTAGIYVLIVDTEKGKYTTKFIKE